MVVKKCPICDQTLPVACKSCHCGHVFVSRKQLMPTQDKTEVGDGNQRDQRLRPEIPKREIKDYEYDYGSKVEMQPGEPNERSMITTQMYLSESSIPDLGQDVGRTEDMRNYLAATASRPMSEILHLPDGYSSSKRKRGRPKGSKNKPKPILQPGEEIAQDDIHTNGQNSESGDSAKRKRGRPKGSKNKPKDPSLLKAKSASTDGWSSDQPDSQDSYHEPYVDRMPLITKDKAISYSIVLSDINQKMMKQSSMNFV